MDQLALAFTPPGIGHNHAPGAIDLIARLTASHPELLARFGHLQLACGRMSDQILDEEDAATAIDFIVHCQLHRKQAQAAQNREKALFLRAGRAVGAVFKRRCEQLGAALAPAVARLKAHHDCLAAAERQQREPARSRASEECRSALAEQSFEERREPAEALCVSAAPAQLEPTHIRLRVRATTSPRMPSLRKHAVETRDSAANQASLNQRPGPRAPKQKDCVTSAPDPRPVVQIKPIWGDQRMPRYYRPALGSLQPLDLTKIAKFRAANAANQARLWRNLPHRMEEIDFLHGGSRVSPEAARGHPND